MAIFVYWSWFNSATKIFFFFSFLMPNRYFIQVFFCAVSIFMAAPRNGRNVYVANFNDFRMPNYPLFKLNVAFCSFARMMARTMRTVKMFLFNDFARRFRYLFVILFVLLRGAWLRGYVEEALYDYFFMVLFEFDFVYCSNVAIYRVRNNPTVSIVILRYNELFVVFRDFFVVEVF